MIVVDSVAVIDALTAVPGTGELHAYLRQEELHAPALLDFEVVSALRGLTLRGLTLGGHLNRSRAADLLTDFETLPVCRRQSADPLRRRAFAPRHNVSAYDAASVVLAESLEYPPLTRGTRPARSSGHDARIEVRQRRSGSFAAARTFMPATARRCARRSGRRTWRRARAR